ncbi:MAG: ABC-2 transporter permease [Clostridia bacterium]|nr:ABC-2 transporter permease [Clostridia bacterium]
MKNLLYKELRLATPLLTVLFLGFALMAFLPGYPILCGAFFIGMGMFQGYQYQREAGDITYSLLLPVRKTHIVAAKYLAAVCLQMGAFALFAAFTWVRMTFLAEVPVYVHNVMMGANPVFLAFVLVIVAGFNVLFLGGFFKTAYNIGRPFLAFGVFAFLTIGAAEALHHLPGMAWTNVLDGSCLGRQMAVLLCAAALYAFATVLSCKVSQKRFEKLDL